jgi:hypothetical protein
VTPSRDVAKRLNGLISSETRANGAQQRGRDMAILVHLEGGLVQSVVSDDPAMIGKRFVVIDYDTEGADIDECSMIEQGDGTMADAVVWEGEITQSAIKL